ncbi:hypothetical protein BHE74_00049621, partial [Ensete ventricosum]
MMTSFTRRRSPYGLIPGDHTASDLIGSRSFIYIRQIDIERRLYTRHYKLVVKPVVVPLGDRRVRASQLVILTQRGRRRRKRKSGKRRFHRAPPRSLSQLFWSEGATPPRDVGESRTPFPCSEREPKPRRCGDLGIAALTRGSRPTGESMLARGAVLTKSEDGGSAEFFC